MYSITITPSANSECLICMDILLNAPDFNKIGTSKQKGIVRTACCDKLYCLSCIIRYLDTYQDDSANCPHCRGNMSTGIAESVSSEGDEEHHSEEEYSEEEYSEEASDEESANMSDDIPRHLRQPNVGEFSQNPDAEYDKLMQLLRINKKYDTIEQYIQMLPADIVEFVTHIPETKGYILPAYDYKYSRNLVYISESDGGFIENTYLLNILQPVIDDTIGTEFDVITDKIKLYPFTYYYNTPIEGLGIKTCFILIKFKIEDRIYYKVFDTTHKCIVAIKSFMLDFNSDDCNNRFYLQNIASSVNTLEYPNKILLNLSNTMTDDTILKIHCDYTFINYYKNIKDLSTNCVSDYNEKLKQLIIYDSATLDNTSINPIERSIRYTYIIQCHNNIPITTGDYESVFYTATNELFIRHIWWSTSDLTFMYQFNKLCLDHKNIQYTVDNRICNHYAYSPICNPDIYYDTMNTDIQKNYILAPSYDNTDDDLVFIDISHNGSVYQNKVIPKCQFYRL